MSDYDGYERALEAIRAEALQAYWSSLLDINVHQVNVGRTYMWVSAALVGAYVAIFDRYQELIASHYAIIILVVLSFSLAALAFGLCLWAIPARRGYRAIPDRGWGEFSQEAYTLLKNSTINLYATFLTKHIATIDNAYAHNFRTNEARAKLLRTTSWLLIASFLVAVMSGIVGVFAHTTIDVNPKENIMSTEDSKPTEQKPDRAPTDPVLNVPEPPPPADIGGSEIHTHSEKPGHGTKFMTEDVDKK